MRVPFGTADTKITLAIVLLGKLKNMKKYFVYFSVLVSGKNQRAVFCFHLKTLF